MKKFVELEAGQYVLFVHHHAPENPGVWRVYVFDGQDEDENSQSLGELKDVPQNLDTAEKKREFIERRAAQRGLAAVKDEYCGSLVFDIVVKE